MINGNFVVVVVVEQVNISQVTTEQELVSRSYELEGALASGSFIQYCNSKVESCTHELEKTLWSFLKVIQLISTLENYCVLTQSILLVLGCLIWYCPIVQEV